MQRRDLDSVVADLRSLDFDDRTALHVRRYLVVRCAGFLEATRDECIRHYSQSKSDPFVASHVKSFLSRGQGASPQQLIDQVKTFSPEWGEELKSFLNENNERRRLALSSLYDSRRKIAHGLGDSVSTRRALDWYDATLEIADWLLVRYSPPARK